MWTGSIGAAGSSIAVRRVPCRGLGRSNLWVPTGRLGGAGQGAGIAVLSFSSQCNYVEIEDGTITGSTTLGTGARTVDCNAGFKLSGTNEIHCTASGEYDEQPGLCEPIGCADPVVANGFATVADASVTTNPIGSLATIGCNEGFTLKGASSVSCHRTTLWSDDDWTGDAMLNPGLCVVQAPPVAVDVGFSTTIDTDGLITLCDTCAPMTEDQICAWLNRSRKISAL